MDFELHKVFRWVCTTLFLVSAMVLPNSQGKLSIVYGPGYRILQDRATQGCDADSIRSRIYQSCLYKREEIERVYVSDLESSRSIQTAHRVYTTNEEEAMLRDILWPPSGAHHGVPASTGESPKSESRSADSRSGHYESSSHPHHTRSGHRRSRVAKYKRSTELEPKRDLREIIAKCCHGPCSEKDFAPFCRDFD